jgi:FAD:protein FMN transferase
VRSRWGSQRAIRSTHVTCVQSLQRVLCAALLLPWLGSEQLRAAAPPEHLYEGSHTAMGTVWTIRCYAQNRETADIFLSDAFEEVDRLDALLSNYRPSSELSRISREAGSGPVVTDPETFGFLERALFWSERSAGAFDITVGPLLRLWGFKLKSGHVPTANEQREARAAVGWEKVRLEAASHSVRFAVHTPMELDPGSIGKGFAVDSVVQLLRGEGVHAARISAGGSTVYGLGAPPGEQGWPVEVPDPRTPGAVATTVYLHDASLSTGACTEKFFVENGHRYCHIFDPRTLEPQEGVLQTTVVAPSATDSDALSTVVFVLPPDQSAAVLRGLQGVSAIEFFARAGQPSCVLFGVWGSACQAHSPMVGGSR